jgi:hypothetical protein
MQAFSATAISIRAVRFLLTAGLGLLARQNISGVTARKKT